MNPIQDLLLQIKDEYESAIKRAVFNGQKYADGNKAKEALIRSQKLINYIHEYVKSEFISKGVNKTQIIPPLGSSKPEISIQGFLKAKNQDVSVLPKGETFASLSPKGYERIISVNIRSQLSSMQKNIDTLYERTFAEALNLHLKYNNICLGEVYLIPTHEYDDKAMLTKQIRFKTLSKIENYINMFQAINMRRDPGFDEYKYERVCLLIVDFRPKQPRIYHDIKELIKDGLVAKGTKTNMNNLSIVEFADDLLQIYSRRFNIKDIV